ncbi:portal protein [Parasutterella excrementihominis]|uniref:portal protein n=1 Tax=Parasutterella excrementihominis TaxID=487175 RepID=UPI0027BADE1D|nr:portal protein [Parasutterella excrementihominis]
MELREKVQSRWDALKEERSSWMSHWKDISEVLLPRAGRFLPTENNRGGKAAFRKILDSTGTRALRTLSGGMMSGMTSPARPWFRLTTFNPELDESYEVKVWMSQVTSLMQMVFYKSNTYRALQMAYEELGAFGTSATLIYDDFDRVIHCHPLTIGEFAIATDSRGRVNTVYREFRMTVAMLVQEFGLENVSRTVKDLYDRGQMDEWVEVINAIEPRTERDPRKTDAKNMPYLSVYFEKSGDKGKVLRETGFTEFPAMCARWSVTGGDIYGTSPGMEALGDLCQLQQMQFRKSQAIDYKVHPPVLIPSEMKNMGTQFLPGGVIPYSNAQQAQQIRSAYMVDLDLNSLLVDIQDVRQRINEAFYRDIFMLMVNSTDKTMTATEVTERHEEKMLLMGPVLERLNAEMLDPLINIVFNKLVQADLLPPLPEDLQGQQLNVEFISILAQAQKAISTNSVDRMFSVLGNLAGMRPDIVDNVDLDFWPQWYADALGVDPRFIVSGKKVAVIREQRAQAEQQAAAMEQLQGATQAAKNMGMTMQGQSPEQIMQAFTGY